VRRERSLTQLGTSLASDLSMPDMPSHGKGSRATVARDLAPRRRRAVAATGKRVSSGLKRALQAPREISAPLLADGRGYVPAPTTAALCRSRWYVY
jgi:hypothetical protein